ncbi:hypothetical protein BC834DRAFT_111187 [Gloeopeniophorella convolvens]|nr:hypothetical protein BC834DRAFT_111187 [Gloeopeniophorella convolvens]
MRLSSAGMDSGTSLALPHSFDDRSVLELHCIRDGFFARSLSGRRFSAQDKAKWIAGAVQSIKGDKDGITAIKNWLKIVSTSEKPGFADFVPPLNDKTYELFVEFFWHIHESEVRKAQSLLRSARLSWGLEDWFDEDSATARLHSIDNSRFESAASQLKSAAHKRLARRRDSSKPPRPKKKVKRSNREPDVPQGTKDDGPCELCTIGLRSCDETDHHVHGPSSQPKHGIGYKETPHRKGVPCRASPKEKS